MERRRLAWHPGSENTNGHAGRNWREDFQIALHIQDGVRFVRPTGNLLLTNIHRVYVGEIPEPSLEDDDLRDYPPVPDLVSVQSGGKRLRRLLKSSFSR
ncbi:hypothetical protein CCS01_01635 [Rhodopila globiformis]|uniref:Uncharacterized protein n=1 Tax=Rhodopila globiformis TaxID=1071 RepID=A0A2S6NNK9_RHOGL|nr:hypothetical protein CCS01_01635 [Rhodopila globiformis]